VRAPLVVAGPELGWAQPAPPSGARHAALRLHDYLHLPAPNAGRPPGIPRAGGSVLGGPGGSGAPQGGVPGIGTGPGRRPLVGGEPMWALSPERVELAHPTRYLRWLR